MGWYDDTEKTATSNRTVSRGGHARDAMVARDHCWRRLVAGKRNSKEARYPSRVTTGPNTAYLHFNSLTKGDLELRVTIIQFFLKIRYQQVQTRLFQVHF